MSEISPYSHQVNSVDTTAARKNSLFGFFLGSAGNTTAEGINQGDAEKVAEENKKKLDTLDLYDAEEDEIPEGRLLIHPC
jgi:hypothetical protein